MLYTVSKQSESYLGVFENYVSTIGFMGNRKLDAYVDEVFAEFASLNPTWVDSCFDQFFVNQTIKPMVQTLWQRGRLPSALDISMAWDQQFNVKNFETRQKNLNELTAVLKGFVAGLKQKLG